MVGLVLSNGQRYVSCAKNREQGSRGGHLSENISRPRVEYGYVPLLMLLLPVPISKTNALRRILNPFLGSDTILLLEQTIQPLPFP